MKGVGLKALGLWRNSEKCPLAILHFHGWRCFELISVVAAYHIHKSYPDQLLRWLLKEKKLHSCRKEKQGPQDPKP